MSVLETVTGIITEMTKREPGEVSPESTISELANDSLQLFELFLRLEQEAGGALTYEEVAHIETVQDVVSFLEARKKT